MLEPWKKSKTLIELNEIEPRYTVMEIFYHPKQTAMARFLVTLKLLDIHKGKIELHDFGPTVWTLTANLLMCRIDY